MWTKTTGKHYERINGQYGREAGATAGVIDGRSVKPTEAAMTRARRSRAASAISSPIRVACRSRSWCMRPTFGTATGARCLYPGPSRGPKLREALVGIGRWTSES